MKIDDVGDVVVELNAVEWDVAFLAFLSLQSVVQLRKASSGTFRKATSLHFS